MHTFHPLLRVETRLDHSVDSVE